MKYNNFYNNISFDLCVRLYIMNVFSNNPITSNMINTINSH